jgi:hypothetical protein
MFHKGDTWYSEFPPVLGHDQAIRFDQGIIAVTAYDTLTGGHAAFYLESIDDKGNACVHKLHLTAGLEGSDQVESTGSGASASFSPESGSNQIYINWEPKEVNEEQRDRGATMRYRSFVVTNDEMHAVIRAAEQFATEVAKGKYVYRLPGGLLGRLTTLPGKRGVNCADFCIEILKRAKISRLKSRLLNTPRSVAGG